MNTTPATTQPGAASEDKTVAVLAYLTIFGFIAALIIHNGKKTSLGAYHLRQVLGLIIAAIPLTIVRYVLLYIPVLGWLVSLLIILVLFAVWVSGLAAAISGQKKPLPVIGALTEQYLGNIFD
jgi:uncharacterized membrane protein